MCVSANHRTEDGIRIHLEDLNEAQQAEDDVFASKSAEGANAELYVSLLFKVQSLLFFDDMVRRYGIELSGELLELGGGFGYLSAYIKKKHPDLRVVLSDVSKAAVAKSRQYEELFGVRLDAKWVTSAEDTPFDDASFSNVLFFASFHHCQHPHRALAECSRILKPGGALLLMLEPACPRWLAPLYDRHVRRSTIRERHYSIGQYRRMFRRAGLSFRHHNYRNYVHRWTKSATLYYVLLSAVPGFMANLLPCSQVIIGRKTPC